MRICYFGTYRKNYARNRIMIDGLRANGIDVVECHVPLWTGIEDRVDKATGGWRNPRFLWRVLGSYLSLLKAYRQVGQYDVLMLGYPGYFDAFPARLLAWLARKPLVLDAFMSMSLIAEERGLISVSPFTGRLIKTTERLACHLPDMLICDTAAYADYYHRTHGVARERTRLVPTGADDRVYQVAHSDEPTGKDFRLIYYGTFIPNHGTQTIIEAARLLRNEPGITFELIGDGPEKAAAVARSRELGLTNVQFIDWMDKACLPIRVGRAQVCLGVFGTTPQSMMTVQNKIYEALAMGKPLISGDSPTVRAALAHGEHIWLCQRHNPQSLAEAILVLKADPELRHRLAIQGHALFRQEYGIAAIGRRLLLHLAEPARGWRR